MACGSGATGCGVEDAMSMVGCTVPPIAWLNWKRTVLSDVCFLSCSVFQIHFIILFFLLNCVC